MKKIYNKGITLIALVITIILMLILAGLSISVFSENGILEKAINSKERAKVAELEENLKIKLLENQALSNNLKDINAYEKYLKENNITEIVTANEITKYITMEDKYIFKAEVKEDEYIEITYEGIIGKIKPQITDVKISKTTNSIKVEVSSILSKDAIYTYYIRKQGEEKYTKTNETTGNINEYVDLDDNTTYEIVIELKAKDSNEIDSYEKTVTLAKVKDLAAGDINYDAVPNVWTNKDVTVTAIAETSTEEFTLQTSKDGEKWTDQQNQKFTENGVMFVRLWDGRNAGSWSNGNVNNIDKTAPIVGTPLNNVSKTTNSMTMNLKTIDEKSGISKIIWYYKLSTESEYKSEIEADEKAPVNGSTNGVRTEQTKNKIFSDLTSGTYNLYAEVYDVAGNVARTPTTGTVDVTLDPILVAEGATIEPSTYTNSNVTVTLPTKTGFTTRYTTDGTVPTTSSTQYTTEFTVSNNQIINYCYSDGVNVGQYGTQGINNIDKQVPVIGTELNNTAKASDNITMSLTATDVDSGLSKIVWYYKKSESTSYLTAVDEDVNAPINGSKKGNTTAQTKTHLFSNLEAGQLYNIYAEVYDVAGNVTRTPTTGTVDVRTGHVFVLISTTTPTCTSNGVKTYKCSVCGEIKTEDNGVALGHSYSSATCTTPQTCSRCSATTGSALGHSYYSYSSTSATCTSNGYTYYRCSNCGDSYSSINSYATGHSDSCYSVTYHSHSGSSSSGGGCYGTAITEKYISSYSLSCTKTAHTHSGSSTSGGGCYGKAIKSISYERNCGLTKHSHTAWTSSSSPGCYATKTTTTNTYGSHSWSQNRNKNECIL